MKEQDTQQQPTKVKKNNNNNKQQCRRPYADKAMAIDVHNSHKYRVLKTEQNGDGVDDNNSDIITKTCFYFCLASSTHYIHRLCWFHSPLRLHFGYTNPTRNEGNPFIKTNKNKPKKKKKREKSSTIILLCGWLLRSTQNDKNDSSRQNMETNKKCKSRITLK